MVRRAWTQASRLSFAAKASSARRDHIRKSALTEYWPNVVGAVDNFGRTSDVAGFV
jgi:hypothetical protein